MREYYVKLKKQWYSSEHWNVGRMKGVLKLMAWIYGLQFRGISIFDNEEISLFRTDSKVVALKSKSEMSTLIQSHLLKDFRYFL